MLRSAISDSLCSRDFIISWLNRTPHATAVYASCSALPPPHATLASRRPARPYLSRTSTGWIAPALPGAFHSLDHLVGAQQNGSGHIDTKHLRGLQIDDRLAFIGLFDGNIAGFRALENSAIAK